MDWGIAYNEDYFIINIDKESNRYPDDFPPEVYLLKDQIKELIDKGYSNNYIRNISKENLLFTTIEDALNNLIDIAKVNTLCTRRIYLDKNTGNLILIANGKYEDEDNSCIFGSIDLINGETEVYDGFCWI